jgi:MFS family permease
MKNFYTHTIQPIVQFDRHVNLFLLTIVIDGIIFSGWILFFNFYILEAGFSRDFLGMVNSAPSVAALILGVPIGWLSDHLRPRRAMILGIFIMLIAMIVEVTSANQWIVLTAAFIHGAAYTLFIISQAPLMMKLADGDARTLLFSLSFGLQTLSGVVGNLFAGQLPAFFGGVLGVHAESASAYQAVLIASVLIGTTAIIPLLIMREPQHAPAQKKDDGGTRFPRELIVLISKLLAPQAVIGLGAAILIPYANVFFRERHAISDELLGVVFSLSALITGIGSLIGPRLAIRLGSKIKAVVFTQFSSLIFLLLIGFSPWLWIAIIAFLLRGALMNMSAPLYSAFTMEQVPEHEQGMVNSLMNVAWSLGWSVGPYISGVVQERYGFSPLFIATAVLYFASLSMAWVFFRNSEKTLNANNAN